ncbi:ester cyclase [Actinomycetospora straminea]|uniref:SnoaL-like polyketide cyclase n=1 Tax=Actinomycetospora straminea TaxID=663607 RepID=A0ABP9E239_9PSEU|nr:ester cyclase [Actinomycetospora straminea]MDD7931013.1 ester cyclase [Actinomycetospora straminea]
MTNTQTMTTAEALARQVIAHFEAGEIERIGDLVTEDFVDHGAPPWMPRGREAYVTTMRWLKDVLRIRYEIRQVVAQGDRVAARAIVHGVSTSDHLGFPPTGRPFAMETMHLYVVRDGRLAEHWGVRDELGALWQCGALPTPAPPAEFLSAGA